MSDPLIDSLKENEKILSKLSDDDLIKLALAEIIMEMGMGRDVPPGTKAKRITLSAVLTQRAGVKW